MSDQYQDITKVPLTPAPLTGACVLIVQAGKINQVPVEAILPIDRAITSKAELNALPVDDITVGAFKWFINASRAYLECWEYRADGKWHQVL